MARRHLAIFVKGLAREVLSGKKKIDIRLSQSKVLPYLEVAKDDVIYLKNSGGKIVGEAKVDNVLYYDDLNPSQIGELQKHYQEDSATDDDFWRQKKKASFASVIFLVKPKFFLTPIKWQKNDRRAWVKIEEKGEKK